MFTTRHDTLFGAKFMAIAPDHPLAAAGAQKNPKLAAFISETKRHGTRLRAAIAPPSWVMSMLLPVKSALRSYTRVQSPALSVGRRTGSSELL